MRKGDVNQPPRTLRQKPRFVPTARSTYRFKSGVSHVCHVSVRSPLSEFYPSSHDTRSNLSSSTNWVPYDSTWATTQRVLEIKMTYGELSIRFGNSNVAHMVGYITSSSSHVFQISVTTDSQILGALVIIFRGRATSRLIRGAIACKLIAL